ncbi:dienelactone hydrolase family protein [Paenibacillus sp.]|jgi:dienelactone hydrolase|uniref:alpha/beta hydrolase family protein n=1 Tax=Paenibacillus sp. TaxID=58172 RepID=UPI002837DA93|nr:dienelactone hydrolase family protein [Paenibacillus sp.]MDR0267543.1 dienelactone hydrolase family protein [Paenibacillus sp.]
MRLFEILLAVSCLVMLNYLIFFKKPARKNTVTAILGAISIGLLLTHLFVEGYRWQMGLIYVINILLLCYAAAGWRKQSSQSPKIGRRLLKYGFYVASMLLLAVSIGLSVILPVFRFPEPTGKYKVGTEVFHFVDQNRKETFTDNPDQQRELMVRVWYPAEQQTNGHPAHLFPENKQTFDNFIGAFAKQMGIPQWTFSYLKYINTHAYEKATAMRGESPYPLVILSHGMGTGMILHASQAENLASHGYVVAAIDHTYNTTATAFPDGKVTGYKIDIDEENFLQQASEIGKVWAEDAEFVIDQLAKINAGKVPSGIKGIFDLQHIGMMGHSFGGATAFDIVSKDDRVEAGIDMDGTLFEATKRKQISKPFLFMRAEDYLSSSEEYIARSDAEKPVAQHLSAELDISQKAAAHGGNLLLIDGAGHYNFTDLQLFTKLAGWTGMAGKIDGKRGAEIVDRYVLEFFDEHLKGIKGKLLNGPSSAYPEVKFIEK